MTINEVAGLLGYSKERVERLIVEGLALPKSGIVVKLGTTTQGSNLDISEDQFDEFVARFEAEEPGRWPPAAVRRTLLVEAKHRCAICEDCAPLQFHHMLDWAKIKHHDVRHMLALCGTCHTRCTNGFIDYQAQLIYKNKLKGAASPESGAKKEELQILQKAAHGILDALRFLWMDRDGGMRDLEGYHVGHYMERIGHTAAHLEPALPTFADHFSLLARVSRRPFGTIAFTASSTTEYVIRHGIWIAKAIDGAFRDRTIRKQDGLGDEEREMYRKSWHALREPFSNSCMLPTYARCVELAAEVDWEYHRALGLLPMA